MLGVDFSIFVNLGRKAFYIVELNESSTLEIRSRRDFANAICGMWDGSIWGQHIEKPRHGCWIFREVDEACLLAC